jgi:hypothetical protein
MNKPIQLISKHCRFFIFLITMFFAINISSANQLKLISPNQNKAIVIGAPNTTQSGETATKLRC